MENPETHMYVNIFLFDGFGLLFLSTNAPNHFAYSLKVSMKMKMWNMSQRLQPD